MVDLIPEASLTVKEKLGKMDKASSVKATSCAPFITSLNDINLISTNLRSAPFLLVGNTSHETLCSSVIRSAVLSSNSALADAIHIQLTSYWPASCVPTACPCLRAVRWRSCLLLSISHQGLGTRFKHSAWGGGRDLKKQSQHQELGRIFGAIQSSPQLFSSSWNKSPVITYGF